jgi:hypothetical protein
MDRQEILLKEYEICEQQNNSIGHEVWSSTTIFLTVSVTLLAGLIYGTMTNDVFTKLFCRGNINIWPIVMALSGVMIVGIGIIIIFCRWIGWLKRTEFLTRLNYETLRDIETNLGMEKNWLARGLDLKHASKKLDPLDEPPETVRNKLGKLDSKIGYAPPAGFVGLKCIACTVIAIWGVSIFIIFLSLILRLTNLY